MAGNGENQWTKLADANTPESRRARKRWQELYKADTYLEMADKHIKGQLELSDSQIKTLSMVLDRVAPKLSSVEQKTVNEFESMSEEEMKEYVRALFLSHPELLRQFAPGIRDASQQTEPNAVQHSQPDGDKAA